MERGEAKDYALDLLRRRLTKGWTRASVEETAYEGSTGPGMPGYVMSGGKISVPHCLRHGDNGAHTFRLAALFEEIDSPQGGLFT